MSIGSVAEFFLAKNHNDTIQNTDTPAVITQPSIASKTPDEIRRTRNELARLSQKGKAV